MNLPAMQETQVRSLGQEDPLEKEMSTHSNILAWRIAWTEEPGGVQSTGLQRVGHDWVTNTRSHTYTYILFIHLSVDGHLGCFHTLAIINNADMNIGVHVSFQISVFVLFRYVPRSEIAGSYGILFLVFWGTSILSSMVAAPIYIPTKSAQGFPFLQSLASTCYLLSFW